MYSVCRVVVVRSLSFGCKGERLVNKKLTFRKKTDFSRHVFLL